MKSGMSLVDFPVPPAREDLIRAVGRREVTDIIATRFGRIPGQIARIVERCPQIGEFVREVLDQTFFRELGSKLFDSDPRLQLSYRSNLSAISWWDSFPILALEKD